LRDPLKPARGEVDWDKVVQKCLTTYKCQINNRQSRTVKKNILIIDDDEIVLKTYQDILESMDCHVELAGNGKDGIQKAEERKPDLVILDLHMPIMNGVETLYGLRKLYPHLPIYIVTAFYDDFIKTLKRTAMQGIHFEMLHKPIGANALRAIVDSVSEGSTQTLEDAGEE